MFSKSINVFPGQNAIGLHIVSSNYLQRRLARLTAPVSYLKLCPRIETGKHDLPTRPATPYQPEGTAHVVCIDSAETLGQRGLQNTYLDHVNDGGKTGATLGAASEMLPSHWRTVCVCVRFHGAGTGNITESICSRQEKRSCIICGAAQESLCC